MDVAGALRAARGGAQRVGGNVIRVDGGAGGAVGDGNGAGAQVEIVGEGNGDARAARERAGEAALVHVEEFILSVGGAESGLGLPDRAVVPPRERGHEGAAVAVVAVVRDPDLAGPGHTAREGRREVARPCAADGERDRALVIVGVEGPVLKGK